VTSFIRTIPRTEDPSWVDRVTSRNEHFIPLPFFPARSRWRFHLLSIPRICSRPCTNQFD